MYLKKFSILKIRLFKSYVQILCRVLTLDICVCVCVYSIFISLPKGENTFKFSPSFRLEGVSRHLTNPVLATTDKELNGIWCRRR